jgi:hypothetical protein
MKATRALNIHEETIRVLDQALELVLGLFLRTRGVK